MHQKLVPPRPFFILVNNSKKPLYAINSFKTYFERGLSNTFKNIDFIFSFEPSLFWWTYQKQKRPRTSDPLQATKWVHKNFFISYILSEQLWWCNTKQFLSYSKYCTCKFMQANSWHHKLFHFHWSFWIWKVWKGRGKITKIWISREWKKLFWLNKKHFSQFLKDYH